MLLFYPCIWGLSLSNYNILEVYHLCIIFLIGSCGMRAVGCIWNDFNDKNFDIFVSRTKNRLIASRKISLKEIIIYSFINLTFGILPLFFIGKFSVFLCIMVLPLIISYPFMKRITWWPQLWLGLNFNWGILVGYYSVSDIAFNLNVILFYIGSIFFTIAYDTIYGFQDIDDDLKIGVKSTSIKFRKKPKVFLLFNYFGCYLCWFLSILFASKPLTIILIISIMFILLIINTLKINFKNPLSCEKSFKYNSIFGFCISLTLVIFNFILI